MANMDNGLTVPKWVLIVRQKTPQMPQNLSAQFVCPSPKVLDFNEKRLHWASVVRAFTQGEADPNYFRSVFTSFSRRYSANTEY
jgi:hypothetical protein